MIIVELIKILVFYICRFFVWIFTSRDCEHCKYGCDSWGGSSNCRKDYETANECLGTIHRKNFKRERWFA